MALVTLYGDRIQGLADTSKRTLRINRRTWSGPALATPKAEEEIIGLLGERITAVLDVPEGCGVGYIQCEMDTADALDALCYDDLVGGVVWGVWDR